MSNYLDMDEETYMIDMDYVPRTEYVSDYSDNRTLTAAIVDYLRYKGLTVYKANAPVVKFEGKVVEMISVRSMSSDINTMAQGVYDEIIQRNPRVVLFYGAYEKYSLVQPANEAYQPVGDKYISERRYIRYGVISNDED